jgi:hypothetical protein
MRRLGIDDREVLLDREVHRPQPLERQKLALDQLQRQPDQLLHHRKIAEESSVVPAGVPAADDVCTGELIFASSSSLPADS